VSGTVERRQKSRFPIALPVELEQGEGITRNISASGAFIETHQTFSTGALIQLTLLLKSIGSVIPTRLHCQGKIVRAEWHREKPGIGVAFTSYRFEALGNGGV
jgi:hypothetical protein